MRCETPIRPRPVRTGLQHREVEVGDRLGDEAALVLAVEHLAGDLGGGDERQLGDLAPDLLERALGLGGDLAPRLLEPALAVDLRLLLDALALRLGDVPGLGEDRLGVGSRLRHQLLVLLEQPAGLFPRLVRLLERQHDPRAPVVDRLLDRLERVALEHEEGHAERDQGPDHQTRDDLDQL